jgi:uncharacterized SAM-binding protein YcdF (DUF218 family)
MMGRDERSMSIARSNNSQGAQSVHPVEEAPARRSFAARALTKLARAAALIAVFVAVVFALGFLWFAMQVPTSEVRLTRDADGIVVLTGGSSRVNDAFELLASKRGRRLLITGVYPATNRGEISRVMPEYEQLFNCCVDLDRTAVNTLGNAIGTRRWAEAQGFRSLIVVTSAYHMPRALSELAHQLPGVELVPYPVVSERMRSEPWWSHAGTAKLLFSEYVKYIVAAIRMRLDPTSDATALSRFSDLRIRLGGSRS